MLKAAVDAPARGLRARLLAPLLAGWLLWAPLPAAAHGAMPGMEGFGIGLTHALVTPVHLLLLLVLGLWLGQHPPVRLRAPLSAFAALSALGLLLTTLVGVPTAWPLVLSILALGTAALVAGAVRHADWTHCTLAAVVGLAVGLDSGVDAGESSFAVLVTLFAHWVGMNLLVGNLAFYTSLVPPLRWARIAIQVAGSWTVAICLLVLAFALRPLA